MARLTNLTQCDLVEYGYAQVEPNHLSAQRTGQIYAQLPAAADITILENGQFAKYDYVKGVVNFDTANTGEWMLVYNEVKVYRDYERDCDFAMLSTNYGAYVYSPITGNMTSVQPVDWTSAVAAADPYTIDSTDAPMGTKVFDGPKMMNGSVMVPRLLKTNIGDIFTTNAINLNGTDKDTDLTGKTVTPGVKGILTINSTTPATGMVWQIVKDYTMPDGQRGVKIMRIA